MASRPQCVFYLAGADPYEDDQLGGLRLTRDGLRRRDRLVIETVRAADVPLVVTLAGGYARRIDDTVSIHTTTIEEARQSSLRSASARTPRRSRARTISVFRSMISPRATIAFASAAGIACVVMSSSSSAL